MFIAHRRYRFTPSAGAVNTYPNASSPQRESARFKAGGGSGNGLLPELQPLLVFRFCFLLPPKFFQGKTDIDIILKPIIFPAGASEEIQGLVISLQFVINAAD